MQSNETSNQPPVPESNPSTNPFITSPNLDSEQPMETVDELSIQNNNVTSPIPPTTTTQHETVPDVVASTKETDPSPSTEKVDHPAAKTSDDTILSTEMIQISKERSPSPSLAKKELHGNKDNSQRPVVPSEVSTGTEKSSPQPATPKSPVRTNQSTTVADPMDISPPETQPQPSSSAVLSELEPPSSSQPEPVQLQQPSSQSIAPKTSTGSVSISPTPSAVPMPVTAPSAAATSKPVGKDQPSNASALRTLSAATTTALATSTTGATTTTTAVAAVAAAAASAQKPLNVKDALSYLDEVKYQFNDQPDVYNRFLDIMKEFKSSAIDTPGVIDRVTVLFRGKPNLINGFNTFLPPGYRIEAPKKPGDPIKVFSPVTVSSAPAVANPLISSLPNSTSAASPQDSTTATPRPVSSVPAAGASVAPSPSAASGKDKNQGTPIEFNHAINYVNKIKNRFASEPDVYRQFLEILQMYQKEHRPIREVYAAVSTLFKESTDLLEEFKQFLPDVTAQKQTQGSLGTSSNGVAVPQMTTKQPVPAQSDNRRHAPGTPQGLPQQPKKKVKTSSQRSYEKMGTTEELEFFDKVKRAIGSRQTYNEFLKILNLFSQEVIDRKTLVERVTPFLEKTPELLDWFKKFVKYEEEQVVWNVPAERPQIDLKTCKASGHSYRLLPKSVPRSECPNRDSLCREVLNDDWISHPVYLSETGFIAHKKNIYEEALYKCEEERYEFDRHIEANLHTIALLEPIAKKIAGMNAEQRAKFQLPVGLGGLSKTIYQRVIKKIYGKDRGQEVIDAIHQNPAIAVPIVLRRLKQKDEEWKRARREWNKVWKDIDAKNRDKALDHQGINFKTSDRKTMSSKNLCNEIETLYREQKDKREASTTAPIRYQTDFSFKDPVVFRDTHNILVHALSCLSSINQSDEERVREEVILKFLPKFFFVDFELDLDDVSSSSDKEEDDGSVAGSSTVKVEESDKSLLKNGLTKNTKSSSSGGTETKEEKEDNDNVTGLGIINIRTMDSFTIDENSNQKEPQFVVPSERNVYSFYANSNLYVMIRLYQMFYSRLYKMKEMSEELSFLPPHHAKTNALALEIGIAKAENLDSQFNEKDRYTDLLKLIKDFIEGKVETSDFEEKCRAMYTTSAYLIYTVDKLAQSLTKQMQIVVSDPRSMELINLYYMDSKKTTSSARQEAMYRLSSESHVDDNLYRLEYFMPENVLTIQLIGREDQVNDDTITSEDKWSLYVDHFVQLSTTEDVRFKRRDPFLRRNLPDTIPEESPTDVETKSGLELKICVNTYRIFFVENTEDYFRRKTGPLEEQWEVDRVRRHQKFSQWLESEQGWKRELASEPAKDMEKTFEDWIQGPKVHTDKVEKPGFHYRKFTMKEGGGAEDGMEVDQ